MERPDCVREGDHETERLLQRAFRAGFHEGELRTLPQHLDGAFEDWRAGVVTRRVPALSPPQVTWLIDHLEACIAVMGASAMAIEVAARLRELRSELTKEDDGAGA